MFDSDYCFQLSRRRLALMGELTWPPPHCSAFSFCAQRGAARSDCGGGGGWGWWASGTRHLGVGPHLQNQLPPLTYDAPSAAWYDAISYRLLYPRTSNERTVSSASAWVADVKPWMCAHSENLRLFTLGRIITATGSRPRYKQPLFIPKPRAAPLLSPTGSITVFR